MKFYLLFFILISNQLFSQSFSPIITNYSKSEYLGESPIWDITENKEKGIIYFANNRNILKSVCHISCIKLVLFLNSFDAEIKI